MTEWCKCEYPTISAHRRRDCPHTPFSKVSGGCNLGDPTVVLASAGQPPDARFRWTLPRVWAIAAWWWACGFFTAWLIFGASHG
jgi:hypothetical protein